MGSPEQASFDMVFVCPKSSPESAKCSAVLLSCGYLFIDFLFLFLWFDFEVDSFMKVA